MAGSQDELQQRERAPVTDPRPTAGQGNGRPARARKSRTGVRARQLAQLRDALADLRDGDFSVRLPTDGEDDMLAEIADVFNQVVARNQELVKELSRVNTSVGREGNMDDRVELRDARGDWTVGLASLNSLINGLVAPTSEVARVIRAVAEGDLSQKMVLEIDGKEVQGEFLRIGTTVNRMVDQLNAFAGEVTRVAKEVGTDGKLGGQARVEGVAGSGRAAWGDMVGVGG